MARITPDSPGVDDPGAGRRLGVDVGTVRIGVAVSDRDAMLASPVETVKRTTGLKDRDSQDIDRLLEIIDTYDVVEVVVGLPRNLDGSGSSSVKHAKDIAFRINRRLSKLGRPIPVRMADERLSTVIAHQALHMSGRKEKHSRSIVDQVAAVEILQSWLDGRTSYLKRRQAISPSDESTVGEQGSNATDNPNDAETSCDAENKTTALMGGAEAVEETVVAGEDSRRAELNRTSTPGDNRMEFHEPAEALNKTSDDMHAEAAEPARKAMRKTSPSPLDMVRKSK